MKTKVSLPGVFAATFLIAAVQAFADGQPPAPQAEQPKVEWTKGPGTADLGDVGEIQVPKEYVFADKENTTRLLTMMGNFPDGTELGTVSPASDKEDWFVFFEFDASGYVKDDDKDKLDADGILASIREATEAQNEQRKAEGMGPMEVVGWHIPPRYDEKTHNLVWAVKAKSEGKEIINMNTRVLGREGVMRVTWVGTPEQLVAVQKKFEGLLGGYQFKAGKKYAEYRPGDKLAGYGLAALVAGGTAAALAQSGVFKKIWGALVALMVAAAAGLKKVFGRKKPQAPAAEPHAGKSDRKTSKAA